MKRGEWNLTAQLMQLVHHGLSVSVDDIPPDIRTAVTARFVDVVGCALGGARADGCAELRDLFVDQGGAPEASVLGTAYRLPAANAAMTNAICARSFDFEVMTVRYHDELIPSHHAATIVPVALALGQATGASGAEILAAMLVGEDLSARLLIASGLDFGQGWDGSGLYSGPGAALTAARLLHLTPNQTIHAIGLAVAQLSHTIQDLYDGSTGFKFGQGTAARNAIVSVQLAKGGWTGMLDPLGARFGFFNQYTGGCARPEVFEEAIGATYFAEAHFKKYSSCMATHIAIEAALEIVSHAPVEAQDIAAVRIAMPAARLKNFCAKAFVPREFPHCDAIFNYAFPVALALQEGCVVPDLYLRGDAGWAAARRLTDLTQYEPSTDGRPGCEVVVTFKDGSIRSGYCERLSADPRDGDHDEKWAHRKYHMQALGAGWTEAGAESLRRSLAQFWDATRPNELDWSLR